MINKNEFLHKDSIKITSYNYEESKGFSQETSVEKHFATYKEHKFVIDIEGEKYALEFLHSNVIEKYAAMEEEWVEMENVIQDNNKLTIRKLNNEEIERGIPEIIYESNDFSVDIENFKHSLVKAAREIGIGCHYLQHFNREDDFCKTYPDIEDGEPYLISDEVLFINDNEKDFFKQYISLNNNEKEKEFLSYIQNKTIENEKFMEEKEPEEEPCFESEEEWLEYIYSKPCSLTERFEIIKKYIDNDLKKEIIPESLKETFNIKNQITDFLENKIKENKKNKKNNIKFNFG